jgi:hypothetical protein
MVITHLTDDPLEQRKAIARGKLYNKVQKIFTTEGKKIEGISVPMDDKSYLHILGATLLMLSEIYKPLLNTDQLIKENWDKIKQNKVLFKDNNDEVLEITLEKALPLNLGIIETRILQLENNIEQVKKRIDQAKKIEEIPDLDELNL